MNSSGKNKMSFELDFKGGKIWCEHLDSMGSHEDEVIEKFQKDSVTFFRPSISSFMIISLQNTVLTPKIAECISDTIIGGKKRFMRISFHGVEYANRRILKKIKKQCNTIVGFHSDFEKAKKWVLD